MSRPSSYKKRYASEASKLCLVGATDQILAEHFGVSTQTISNWKNSKPEFFEAIKAAKQKADSQVQKSLFKRATGYKTTLTRTISDEDGRRVKFEKITKDVAPDPRASRLWLRNRQPEEWQDDNNALLVQQANELQKLHHQAVKDKRTIKKLETEFERIYEAYEAINRSLKEQEDVIGESLLNQIYEAMLDVRDSDSGYIQENFTLDETRFKASLIQPLTSQLAPQQDKDLPSTELPSNLKQSPLCPAAELSKDWRLKASEGPRLPDIFTT